MKRTNIFLSVAWPFLKNQEKFLNQIERYFEQKGYTLKKVNIQKNHQGSTIKSVLNRMEECEGMIVIAFKRMEIKEAIIRPDTNLDKASRYYRASEKIQSKCKTSDWCNIEIGMAFGMNLPILAFFDDCIIKQDIYTDDDIQILNFNVDKNIYDLALNVPEEWCVKIQQWENQISKNDGREGLC